MLTFHVSALSKLYFLAFSILPLAAVAQSENFNDNDPGGSDSENPATQDPDTAGASGSSQSAVSLSTGAQIAIAVVVGIVVLLGLTSAVLFYVAKKRQWEVRASIRRSARRVTTAVKAKTPVKANFSRRDKEALDGAVRMRSPARSDRDARRSKHKKSAPTLNLKGGRSDPNGMERDVEKGFGTQTRVEARSAQQQQQQVPESSFDMDSPLTGGNRAGDGEKGRGWMKILGRK